MGSQCSGEANLGIDSQTQKLITVTSLNYCGLSTSPYEFYVNQYEHQLEKIGQIFYSLCSNELNKFVTQKSSTAVFGQLQLKFKKGRYSPMFKPTVGITEKQEKFGQKIQTTKQFQNQKQFCCSWDQVYQKQFMTTEQYKQQLKKCKDKQKLQKFKQNLRKYDFLMFRALLQYVYKFQKYQKFMQSLYDIKKYESIISPFFELSFLNEAHKLSIFQYGFRKTNPDVFFLQQSSQQLIKFLDQRARTNYWWAADGDQVVIIKKKTFGYQPFQIVDLSKICSVPLVEPKAGEKLNAPLTIGSTQKIGNNRKNYLFACLHFSSKQIYRKDQLIYLNKFLQDASKHYENVIVGGDLNEFVTSFPKGFQYYPKVQQDITTFKRRTRTQAQIQKGNIYIKKSIDKIITNAANITGAITLIDSTLPDMYKDDEKKIVKEKLASLKKAKQKQPNSKPKQNVQEQIQTDIKMMLPCDSHPFDQFLVNTKVPINISRKFTEPEFTS